MMLVTFLVLADVNTTLLLVFDVVAPISPLMLVLVLISLSNLVRTENGISLPIKLLLASLGLYVIIGSASALIHLEDHHPMLFEEEEHMLRIRGYITSMLLVFTYFLFIRRKIKEGRLFRFLLFCGWIFILTSAVTPLSEYLNIVQYYQSPMIDHYGRMTGLYKGPGDAGIQATFALLFSLFFILNSYYKGKMWYMLLSFVALYSALVTFSKASILTAAFLLVLFLMAVLIPRAEGLTKKGGAHRSGAVNVFIALLIGVAFIIPGVAIEYYQDLTPHQQERIDDAMSLVQGEVSDETTSDRNAVAEEGLKLISEHPFFGNGIASFHRLPGKGLGVHNTYLMILGESGLVPFALFLVFVILMLWRSYKLFRYQRVFGFIVIGAIVIMFLEIFLPTHTALIDRRTNVMLAFCLAVLSFHKELLINYEEE